MFYFFWEEAYLKIFDGKNLLIPAIHPDTDMATLPILSTVHSHGSSCWDSIPCACSNSYAVYAKAYNFMATWKWYTHTYDRASAHVLREYTQIYCKGPYNYPHTTPYPGQNGHF